MSAASAFGQESQPGLAISAIPGVDYGPYNSSMRNSTDSPLYPCKAGGVPADFNTTLPLCVVPGGATHMQACCNRFSNNTSLIQFRPDCYVWCNVNLPSDAFSDPWLTLTGDFTACLMADQPAGYFPELSCMMGHGTAIRANSSTYFAPTLASTSPTQFPTATTNTPTTSKGTPTSTTPSPTSGAGMSVAGLGVKAIWLLLALQVFVAGLA